MIGSDPLVSVCIPVYNGALYIRESIKSLLNQSYSSIEIIVVDDGSTDDTNTVLHSINDTRLKFITQKNKGA